MKKTFRFLLAASLFVTTHFTRSADYQGADAVLKQVASRLASEKSAPAKGSGETAAKITADLKAFRETAATLPPDEAAKRWLDLVDRFARYSDDPEKDSNADPEDEPLNMQAVMASLPPPPAWDAIARAVEQRPQEDKISGRFRAVLLRMIAHRLKNDTAALEKDLDELKSISAKPGNYLHEYSNQFVERLRTSLLQDSDDGAVILANLNATLDQLAKSQTQGPQQLEVPDLVSLVGEKKAADFLRRALRTPNAQISIGNGNDTKKLARKLAVEGADQLRAPQWQLARSIDATALYEALEKRFPGGDASSYEHRNAQTYYLLGLIASHRTKEATALAMKLGDDAGASLPYEGIQALEKGGRTRELVDFFHDLLAQKPDLPFWSDYVPLAAKVGEGNKMVALVETAAARKGLTDKQRMRIQKQLRAAYLAADRVDDGIAVLRKEIAEAKKKSTDETDNDQTPTDPGLALAKLGEVLERKDLTDEGIQAARTALKEMTAPRQQSAQNRAAKELAALLLELQRGPEAEEILTGALIALPKPSPNAYYDSSTGPETLTALMQVYHLANRPADVLALLDHAPQWGRKDLADLIRTTTPTINRNSEYAGFLAAHAFAALDRKPEARKILDTLMDREGSYDPAFELLMQLAPDDFLARMDTLFARDKYEERPLIWKAKKLLEDGKLEEAESVAKQAISIDPSDGEEGPGRRMRAYAVLADIREARGDKKEADFLRGAVTAIRHSENADRFYEAGLITRAVKGYEESLTHFADAYCIQSRLALRLAETGDMAGAEEHYRRAYELMPQSFGRVESHCFGCERAFAGERPQSIAEKVFTALAEKTPDKPQVHYLLGYLRKEQERYREALPEFRKAVKLDPEYLNAWKNLAEVGKEVRLPAAERSSIALQILRLDPLQRHSSFDARNVIDLRAAWEALDSASKLRPKTPGSLYPLAASAKELEQREKDQATTRNRRNFRVYGSSRDSGEESTPGRMIASQEFIQAVCELFSYSGQLFPEQRF